MRQVNLLEKKIIIEKPDSVHNYFAWPTVTTLRDGSLAAVASGFRFDHVCPFGKSVIAYSYDGGKSWTEPNPVIDTILDDRDAGILNFGENDVIFTSFNNSIAFQKGNAGEKKGPNWDYIRAYLSHVENLTELEEKFLGSTFKFSRDGGKTWEKTIHRSPVTAPHGPMETKDGRLIYIGNVFGTFRLESWEIDGKTGEMVKLGTVPPIEGGKYPSDEPHAIELSDGRILLIIRTEHQPANPTWQNAYDLFTMYESFSSDGGKTWTVPAPLTLTEESAKETSPENLGAPPHLFRHSSGALILSCATRIQPIGIQMLISRDEGKSWDAFVLTEDVPNTADIGYPATTELPDGSLYTVWYQHPALDAPAVIYGAHWEMPR